MIKLVCLIATAVLSASSIAEELSIQVNPQIDPHDEVYSAKKNKPAIFGVQGNLGIRKDLEEKVREYSMGYKERIRQLLVHSRAHDLYMAAESPEEAYNAYLLMTAAQKCFASLNGVGESGASTILFRLAQHQIDTEVRRQAVIRSEYMLKRGDYPALKANMKNAEFCNFTQQPIIVNKELTQYLETREESSE
ncbi:hypothetical protein OH460_08895 [Vibrio sp. Makdt]|uniref:hypothetical protein n=1 Tax=Vibrio sp. Makdt TaxID=2998828 RepID=UPI0022CDB299|nr:hypothetical protein [Vibrio sp. Makdt]MDA0152418.1 hypothetical protein [Vibrio sp. Makdt]